MDLHVLGPVEATVDDQPVAIGAGKPRALLAMLALSEGTAGLVRGADRRAVGRGAAGDGEQDGAGLRLAAAQGVRAATATAPRSSPAATATSCGSAAARSTPTASSASSPTARRARRSRCGAGRRSTTSPPSRSPVSRSARLEELRLDAVELALQQDLDAGRHAEVVRELQALIAQEPLRERLHGLLMLALYRFGRQAEALGAYRRARDGARRRDRRRARARAAPPPRGDPAPGPVPRPAAARRELPPELEDATPLVGRDAELATLREHWRRAQAGDGAVLAGRRRARHRQDAARRRAGRRGPRRRRPRPLRIRRRAARAAR